MHRSLQRRRSLLPAVRDFAGDGGGGVVKALLAVQLQKAAAAAAMLTGKKFALLVASSLVATTGIVAAALTGSGGLSPMTEAAARALLEEQPAALATAPAPEAAEGSFSPPPPEAAPSASSGPEAAPASVPSAAPQALPAPEPETPVTPSEEPELPEAGPVKHVFLISLASPGYEAAFGTSSQMPYLSATLRPQGVLLSSYSLLGASALGNGLAAIGGQAPTPSSQVDCPEYEKCLFPVETLSLADQLTTGRYTWHAYLGDMADPEGKPDSCVHPEPD